MSLRPLVFTLFAFFLLLSANKGIAQSTTAPSVAQIMLTDAVLERIRAERTDDAGLNADIGHLIEDAEAFLQVATLVEEFHIEHKGEPSKLPGLGQKSVERITTLAMAWRLTGEKRYADRARLEIMSFTGLDSWYPAHFLGLSRVTLSVALGYSWLGDALSEDDRKTIRAALIEKALNEGEKIYDLDRHYFSTGWVVPHLWKPPVDVPDTLPDGAAVADITWPVASFNWNIVCNTGMVVAAIAVTEDEPDLSAKIIGSALTSMRNGMAHFAPDGAWPEGPMYGALSGRDAAVMITALESVYREDFGISEAAGLPGFGDYLMHATGPTGLLFNYGDSDTHTDPVVLPWLANRFFRPDYNYRKVGGHRTTHPAFNLIWRRGEGVSPSVREPTSLWFGGYGLVAMRSAWDHPDATYVAFKAGPVKSHHNNLDAGTFVLDSKGVRWGIDLGAGNYELPGYFTSGRFQYYRTATIGQNTLAFGNENQNPTGRAFIEEFAQFPDITFATADLSNAYEAPLGSIRRGIALIDEDAVLIQDELTDDAPASAVWTMHTRADINLEGNRATLTQDGQQMTALILSPEGAQFTTRSANPCETSYNASCDDQLPNTGISRLMIALDDKQKTVRRLAVLFSGTIDKAQSRALPVAPLNQWRLRATLQRRETPTGLKQGSNRP